MFACIYIPDFSAEAVVRSEPLLREHAVAILDGKPPLVRVIALNEKARQLGMEIGMTKLQAAAFSQRSSSPGDSIGLAVLRQRSREQELSAHAALLDVAHAFTPRVEDTAPDTLLLDLEGLDRLYGAPAKMAGDLASRLTRVGIEANIALAANPDAAMHAARGFNGTTIIPAGSEAQRLGVLPLQVLLDAFGISSRRKIGGEEARKQEKLRAQMLDTLERWGVRDFRTLALLPEHALTSRLGERGAKLRQLARGDGRRTLLLCAPPAQFEEAMELDSPVETIDSLSFAMNRLLEQLCARLEARSLATHELRLRLQLERRVADEEALTAEDLERSSCSHNVVHSSIFERSLRLPVSMRDSKVFLKLLQLELAAHLPGAPVIKIWITAEPAPPRTAQRGLFLPVTPEPERLEITLARISSIVGERRAGIARLLNSHRRDSFSVDRFTCTAIGVSPIATPAMSNSGPHLPLTLRRMRPARPLQVGLSEGRPATLVSEKQVERSKLQGKVLWSAGPWRSSGDWWTENMKQDLTTKEPSGPWDREEWDIALALTNNGQEGNNTNVALYRIYRDMCTGNWFADATYD